MFKQKWMIAVIVVACLMIYLVLFNYSRNNKRSWAPTFESNATSPFGTAYVLKLLPSLFNKSTLAEVDIPIHTFLKNKHLKNTNYIFVCDQLKLEFGDMQLLLPYVSEGNNLFIATNNFDEDLQRSLGFYTALSFESMSDLINPGNAKETYVNTFVDKRVKGNKRFVNKAIFDAYQIIGDSAKYQVLLRDSLGNAVMVRLKYGAGNIYLHSFPIGLTNYTLLFKQNHEYISTCFSFLTNQRTFWDNYYKIQHVRQESKLDFIFDHEPLHWAWILLLVSALLFILFNMKRKQRIIPVVAPLKNTSLEFATTIGRLYHNKGDNKDIVNKQIGFWFEYIRTKFNIPTATLDKHFVQLVAEKSNNSVEDVQELINFIAELRYGLISNKDVTQLYQLLQKFYKKSKRI